MGSTTLQTLRDPILLLRWVCFRDGLPNHSPLTLTPHLCQVHNERMAMNSFASPHAVKFAMRTPTRQLQAPPHVLAFLVRASPARG
jgi:hypothetical protein